MGQSLESAIQAFAPELPLAVAYSGGADSTALLLACASKWPGQVVAIHVHHGLQAAADDFVIHCKSVCTQLDVPLTVCRVNGRPAPGQSPEDAARRARYHAFSRAFSEGSGNRTDGGPRRDASALGVAAVIASEKNKNIDFSEVEYRLFANKNIANVNTVFKSIALAQHADDQVETIVLALSRGAGLAGLAAMPGQWQRDGIRYHRPCLNVSASDIRAWLAAQSVPFIEDPSNADEKFTRNRIRARILPSLQQAFPHFRDTFSRSAAHAAQAQAILNEVGAQDLAAVAAAGLAGLYIAKLQDLNLPRQANALRFWLKSQHLLTPSAAQLDELQRQIAACITRGHQINIKVGNGFVKRKGDVLAWYNS